MSKRLNDLFELDTTLLDQDKNTHELTESLPDIPQMPEQALSVLEKIELALPRVKGLEADDSELDELAELAKDQFSTLNDLGMQVDSRFAAEIFSVSSTMLGHAITAKTAKINKKLKLVDLQLKQAALLQKQQQLDAKLAEQQVESQTLPTGQGAVMDRNELLRTLMAQNKTDQN